MPVLCLAVVGADNSPVFLRTRNWIEGQNSEVPPDDIHLLYVLHSSLDTIEERLGQSGQSRDTYLGLLKQSETYRVFGLVTATLVKILVLVAASAPYTVRDTEARSMLKELHTAYVDATASNPFYVPSTQLNSRYFTRVVANLFEQP